MNITRLHVVALAVVATARSARVLPSGQPTAPRASLMIYQDGQAFKDMDGVDLTRAAGNEKRIAPGPTAYRCDVPRCVCTFCEELDVLRASLIVMNASQRGRFDFAMNVSRSVSTTRAVHSGTNALRVRAAMPIRSDDTEGSITRELMGATASER
jgi:hypothetical protein